MAKERWKLTDKQWKRIEPSLPQPKKSRKGGRPWADNRKVFEGILWILRTGAPWADLPQRYSSPSTCWRRLKRWEEQGVWLKIWRAFLAVLDERGPPQADRKRLWTAALLPPKRGRESRKDQKGQRYEVDGGGRRPTRLWRALGNYLDSASPAEVTLLEKTIEAIYCPPLMTGLS